VKAGLNRSIVVRVLSGGLVLLGLLGSPGAGGGRDLAEDPPPDYCKQDGDWVLCQHHHEPDRKPQPRDELPPAQARTHGPDRATVLGSLPR
jgi:hypothetical protein